MSSTAHDEDDATITLPARLDLTAAEPLHRVLLDRLQSGGSFVLAGAAVEQASTAVIQVVLAAGRDARTRGLSFLLRDPSAELTEALGDLGVDAQLGG